MNLIFRLMLLVLRKLFRIHERHPLETATAGFWCLPHDCDFHGHITNSRYASFCDLARISAMFDQKALIPLVKKGCTPILTAQQLVNYKDIKPFKTFEVRSRILGWDDRFWIFRHDFYQQGKLKATVLAKGVFVRGGKMVAFDKVLEIAGHELISPVLPPDVKAWSEGVDALYNEARKVQLTP